MGAGVLLTAFGCADPAAPADDGSNSSAVLGAKDLASVKARAAATGAPATIRANSTELYRMRAFLDSHQLPARDIKLTLQEATGRKIDCVDIDQQPAMRNPAMAGQKVQFRGTGGGPAGQARAPQTIPARFATMFDLSTPLAASAPPPALARACPQGTVPVPRTELADLARFDTLEDYFKKVPSHLGKAGVPRDADKTAKRELEAPSHAGPSSLHQYAVVQKAVNNWGSFSIINVWEQAVQLTSEFSLSQIWVYRGTGSDLQTLESGFQKYNQLYGDNASHFFIYSTRDGYGSTGCYNNSCADFVQVSSWIYPTQSIGTSVAGGAQVEDYMFWEKYGNWDDWWIGDYFEVVGGTTEWVGYYPRTLFDSAGVIDYANEVDYGGEIIDQHTGGSHTSTDMGSGAFPSAGYGYAAYQAWLQHKPTSTGYWTETTGASTYTSDSACYAINYDDSNTDPFWQVYFFFGGPGYHSVNCY